METLAKRLMHAYLVLVIKRPRAQKQDLPNISVHVGMGTKVMAPNLVAPHLEVVSRLILVWPLLPHVMNTLLVRSLDQEKVRVLVFLAILELVHLDNAH